MFKPSCRKSTLGLLADQEVLEVTESLDFAAQNTPLQRDVLMWRGVRNWDKTFGVESLDELKSYDEEQLRFTAISTSRGTAEEDMARLGHS